MQTNSTVILITIKTEGTSGCFLLVGEEKSISQENIVKLGQELCEILDGKGSLQKGNVFHGKVNKINALVKAQRAAQKFVNDLHESIDSINESK